MTAIAGTIEGTDLDGLGKLAADCISQAVDCGRLYAELCGQEMEVEANRPEHKLAAIRRIMATENTLTGKPHSASSAEAIVETDPEYRAYLKAQSEVVVQKNHAYNLAIGARLRAQLAIARFKAEAGLT